MLRRWTIRLAASLLLLGITACASGERVRTVRANEVQVYEPGGQPEKWTYLPNTLGVATGTTVTFRNNGREFHTVTSDDTGRPFDIGLSEGQTGTFTFAKAGTFTYHCGVHPQMKGTIRVCDGGCG